MKWNKVFSCWELCKYDLQLIITNTDLILYWDPLLCLLDGKNIQHKELM